MGSHLWAARCRDIWHAASSPFEEDEEHLGDALRVHDMEGPRSQVLFDRIEAILTHQGWPTRRKHQVPALNPKDDENRSAYPPIKLKKIMRCVSGVEEKSGCKNSDKKCMKSKGSRCGMLTDVVIMGRGFHNQWRDEEVHG